jgi:hypothetical protein
LLKPGHRYTLEKKRENSKCYHCSNNAATPQQLRRGSAGKAKMEYFVEEAILKLEKNSSAIGWRTGDERRVVLMSLMLMLLWQRDSGRFACGKESRSATPRAV